MAIFPRLESLRKTQGKSWKKRSQVYMTWITKNLMLAPKVIMWLVNCWSISKQPLRDSLSYRHIEMKRLRTIDGCASVEPCTSQLFRSQKWPMLLAKSAYISASVKCFNRIREHNKCCDHNHHIVISEFSGSRKNGPNLINILWWYKTAYIWGHICQRQRAINGLSLPKQEHQNLAYVPSLCSLPLIITFLMSPMQSQTAPLHSSLGRHNHWTDIGNP